MSFNLTSVNDKFFINSGGKVGILTSDPQYTLDVNGSIRFGDFTSYENNAITIYDVPSSKNVFDYYADNNFILRGMNNNAVIDFYPGNYIGGFYSITADYFYQNGSLVINNVRNNTAPGRAIFSGKVDTELVFKQLSGGIGIKVDDNSSHLLIEYTGASSNTTLSSIGNGIKIVTGADGNNYNVKSLSGINGIKVATGINDQYLTIEYTGSTTNGLSTSENIITQKNGYGAGIYTFSGSILSTQSGKVFGVFDSKTGCQIFDVMINAGYPVAKKYTVAHQTNQNPITYLNANTGPSGSNDFEALFYASGSSGVAMSIKNLGNDSVFSTTLILGASVSPVVVTAY